MATPNTPGDPAPTVAPEFCGSSFGGRCGTGFRGRGAGFSPSLSAGAEGEGGVCVSARFRLADFPLGVSGTTSGEATGSALRVADAFLVALPGLAFSIGLLEGRGVSSLASVSATVSFSSLTSLASEIGEIDLPPSLVWGGGGSGGSSSRLALLVTLEIGGGGGAGAGADASSGFLSCFDDFCRLGIGRGLSTGASSLFPEMRSLTTITSSSSLVSGSCRFLPRGFSITTGFGDSIGGEGDRDGVLIGEISSGPGRIGDPGRVGCSSPPVTDCMARASCRGIDTPVFIGGGGGALLEEK